MGNREINKPALRPPLKYIIILVYSGSNLIWVALDYVLPVNQICPYLRVRYNVYIHCN